MKAAQLLFENDLYNASANRAYYAAFQAAIAALLRFGIEFDRSSHKSVQATFSGELIGRRKIFPAEMKQVLLELQLIRTDADYKERNISKKVSSSQLKTAADFVQTIEERLRP